MPHETQWSRADGRITLKCPGCGLSIDLGDQLAECHGCGASWRIVRIDIPRRRPGERSHGGVATVVRA
jgi:hypothetical protein